MSGNRVPSRSSLRPAERVRADQVEVVGQADEIARPELGLHPARGRGQDQRLDSQELEHADRETSPRRRSMALVIVEPALEHDQPRAVELADDEVALMAGDGGRAGSGAAASRG